MQTAPFDYYYYETDSESVAGPPRPRFRRIDGGFAATGGPPSPYGDPYLRN